MIDFLLLLMPCSGTEQRSPDLKVFVKVLFVAWSYFQVLSLPSVSHQDALIDLQQTHLHQDETKLQNTTGYRGKELRDWCNAQL